MFTPGPFNCHFYHTKVILQLNVPFGQELVLLHTTPALFAKIQCSLGGSVEVLTQKNLDKFIKCQTHFGMPRGA